MGKIALGVKFLHPLVPACCCISVNGRYRLMLGRKSEHNYVTEGNK